MLTSPLSRDHLRTVRSLGSPGRLHARRGRFRDDAARGRAALDPAALLRVLLETQAGHVWLARHGLLILLAAWVALVPERDDETDWLAARGQAALLGVAALVLLGAAGHAAAVEPGTLGALVVDGVHLLAASIWVGALLPLAAP